MLEFSLSGATAVLAVTQLERALTSVIPCKLVCNMLAMLSHFKLDCSLVFLKRVHRPLGLHAINY